MKGASIRKTVRISFEEAVFGCEKELDVILKDPCPNVMEQVQNQERLGDMLKVRRKRSGCIQPTVTVWYGTECTDLSGLSRNWKIIREKCPDCAGTGYISSKKKISVKIPAGIDDGQSVRIRDKGEPGVNGGPRGDLLVQVTVSRHPIFQRQDVHIFSTVPISFAQAALGADIRIKTVDGEVIYNVKPGTKTDTKVRLKGKGVPSLRNPQVRGDKAM